MDVLRDPLFIALFNSAVPRIILKSDAPNFTIVACNDAFKKASSTIERDVMGKSFWEVYDLEKAGGNGGELLLDALIEAVKTNQQVTMPPYRYNVSSADLNSIETDWWELETIPIGMVDGKAEFLLVAANNVTLQVLDKEDVADSMQREQNLNEELAATNEELAAACEELTSTVEELKRSKNELQELNAKLEHRVMARTNQLFAANFRTEQQHARLANVISNIPAGLCILSGKSMVIEMANDAILRLWRCGAEVIGKAIIDSFPELKSQAFPQLLDDVFRTGVTHTSTDARLEYIIDGKASISYRDYSYTALRNDRGEVDSILVLVADVTERALSHIREQQLSEEIAASNEELSAMNEEIVAANEDLRQSQLHLEAVNRQLKTSETILKQAIDTAYIGTWSANLVTNELSISERSRVIHGMPKGTKITLQQSVEMILPTYREKINEAIKEAILLGRSFEEEFMINPMDGGKPRWLRSTGKASYDENGAAISITGTILDITVAKEDEQRKSDFISIVSHELKTPLTSLKTYVQMLGMRAKSNNDAFTWSALDKVDIQVNKMTTMINGFLNLSRLESGKIYLEKSKFNIDSLLKDAIDEILMVTSSHTITLIPCEETADVFADYDKIGNVISNLLSNAIKYSPKGKTVEVRCELQNDRVLVSVKDDGMGIKAHDIENLFNRYYRVESKQTETISGFGIGLYLSAEIIKRHNGKIWAESEIGVGSTFKFTLPLAK